MNTPEDYILDALEVVSSWDLPDDEAIAYAANQQAKLMSGQYDLDACFSSDTSHDHH